MSAISRQGEILDVQDFFKKEFEQIINEVKADAWDEGAETAWKATGDGHNGEYAHPFGTHDGTAPFQLANPNTPNPYRKQEEA